MPVNIGAEAVAEMLVGEMGIKEALVGDTPVYTRQGGYFYLELDTTQN